MMYPAASTATRSATSTCTESRVDAVLDLVAGDMAAFIAREILSRDSAIKWLRDLAEVLLLEAVERFQVKLKFSDNSECAMDYTVSDDGRISSSDGCGGFSSHWIPSDARPSLVIRWRASAKHLQEAKDLLARRGWGTGTMLDATGAVDRTYSKDGYGFHRRAVGNWQV